MPEHIRPDNNDWTVTGKGMVITRLVWKRQEWTQEAEDACLAVCDAMVDWLQECS